MALLRQAGGPRLVQVARNPEVLGAVNPYHAVQFLVHGGLRHMMAVLGAVLLAVTGREALFADMGHFGRRPIRVSWTGLVYPYLLLNYLGQGAFIHTSSAQKGQIYIGTINWTLMVAAVLLVVFFRTSSNLAAAYGFAVSGVMLVTCLSMIAIAVRVWVWRPWQAVAVFGGFACQEALFFTSASIKVLHGGWIPLQIGAVIYSVMSTWFWGRAIIGRQYTAMAPQCETVARLVSLKQNPTVPQIPRSVVVMASRPITSQEDRIPPALHAFWHRLGALPRHVVFVTVVNEDVPFEPDTRPSTYSSSTSMHDKERGSVTSVRPFYGYMEAPDVRRALARAKVEAGIRVPGDPRRWLVLVGQENIIISSAGWLSRLRLSAFRLLLRNSVPAHLCFGLGTDTHVTSEVVHLPTAQWLGPKEQR